MLIGCWNLSGTSVNTHLALALALKQALSRLALAPSVVLDLALFRMPALALAQAPSPHAALQSSLVFHPDLALGCV